MSILQSENTINPISTSAQMASASAYSSDPSTDPQFMDVSGMRSTYDPVSDEGELVGAGLSATTISSIENQVGVKAVYLTNAAGQVDPAAGFNLYDNNGNLVPENDPRMQEFNKLVDIAGAQQRTSNPNLRSLQTATSPNVDFMSSATYASMNNALLSTMQLNKSSTNDRSSS
jgi:hypothetical protein